jgi:hypothetical protein
VPSLVIPLASPLLEADQVRAAERHGALAQRLVARVAEAGLAAAQEVVERGVEELVGAARDDMIIPPELVRAARPWGSSCIVSSRDTTDVLERRDLCEVGVGGDQHPAPLRGCRKLRGVGGTG